MNKILNIASWCWFIFVFLGYPFFLSINLFYGKNNINFASMLIFIVTIFTTSFWNTFNGKKEYLFSIQLLKMILSAIVSILCFANLYRFGGLKSSDSTIVYSSIDSLYFSIITWTTVGYGDFTPAPEIRMHAAIEALLGTVFIPLILTALIYMLSNKRTAT